MFTLLKFLDVLGEKEVGYAGHGMDGALAGKYDFSVGATNGQNLWFW